MFLFRVQVYERGYPLGRPGWGVVARADWTGEDDDSAPAEIARRPLRVLISRDRKPCQPDRDSTLPRACRPRARPTPIQQPATWTRRQTLAGDRARSICATRRAIASDCGALPASRHGQRLSLTGPPAAHRTARARSTTRPIARQPRTAGRIRDRSGEPPGKRARAIEPATATARRGIGGHTEHMLGGARSPTCT